MELFHWPLCGARRLAPPSPRRWPWLAGTLAATLALAAWAAPPEPDAAPLREFSQTRGYTLGRPVKARFSRDGQAVLFLRSPARSKVQSLFQLDLKTGETRELASPESLLGGQAETVSAEEKARRERLRVQAAGLADYLQHPQDERILLPLSGKLYLLDRLTGKARVLPIAGRVLDPQWSPDGSMVAYVRNCDVFAWDLRSGKEMAVTRGGTQEVSHGLAEFVAQEEMRRLRGFWWSPDSRQIAFEEADHRGVEVWHISDPSQPDKPPRVQRYPRPGHRNVKARLGIATLYSPAVVWAHKPAWAEYMGAVRWDEQGPLTVQWQDRAQRTLELDRVYPATGRLRTLLTEKSPTWVNLHQEVPVWLPGGQEFLFFRAQQGYENLCLVRAQDGDSRCVVPAGGRGQATYDVTEFVSYDPGRRLIHCRVDDVPGSPRALAVELGAGPVGGDVGPGVTEVVASPRTPLRLVTRHPLAEMPQTRVVDLQGKELFRLPSVAEEPTQRLNVEFVPLRDPTGQLLYNTAVVRPLSFDPARKYPVIVDVYGGPRHLHVVQSRKNWLLAQWLADQGFVVVAVDNRGTPGRGLAWETAVSGRLGRLPLEDQIQGVRELALRLPQLDLSRVGIVGWSFGGFLSAQAVLKRPDFFKAAVAGAPVTDWQDYDTHYTERYLGLLPQAQSAYHEASLVSPAIQLQRPLLLVHGTSDDNVYYRNSLRLADALFRAGQPFEAIPLAGITHSYSADPTVTERLWLRTLAFFRQHLGSPQ